MMEGKGILYAATKDNPTENDNRTSSFCAVNASSTDQSTQAQFILRNNLSHSKIYRISIIASPRTMRMPALPISGVQSRISLRMLVELNLVAQRLKDDVVRQTFDTIASLHGVLTLASAHDGVLDRWAASGDYARILSGDYPRREDDRTAKLGEEVKSAARAYQDSWNRSGDPFIGLVRGVADTAAGAGERIFSGIFGGRRNGGDDET